MIFGALTPTLGVLGILGFVFGHREDQAPGHGHLNDTNEQATGQMRGIWGVIAGQSAANVWDNGITYALRAIKKQEIYRHYYKFLAAIALLQLLS